MSAEAKNNELNMEKPLTEQSFIKICGSKMFGDVIAQILGPMIEPLRSEINTLRSSNRACRDELAKLKQHTTKQDQRIAQLEDKIQSNEQIERIHNLRFTGMPSDVERCKEKVIEIATNNLSTAITGSDFQINNIQMRAQKPVPVSKMADPTPAEAAKNDLKHENHEENKDSSTITVRFNNVWQRRKIYANRFRSGSNIFITEDLTREQSKLFYTCRQAKKKNQIKNTWTLNNKIFVLTNDDQKIHIRHTSQIDCITTYKPLMQKISSSSLNSFSGFTTNDIELATLKANEAAQRLTDVLKMTDTQTEDHLETFHSAVNLTQ